MEILQLKYFQEAAKSENISHTAKKFMVPPSSVSSSIKKLESELGITLFDRGANCLKLNENGKTFLRAVDKCEEELKKAKIEMFNHMQMPTGEIRLLMLTNRSRVTDAIMKFKSEYPRVTFSISHDDYADYKNYNKFDIIISDRIIDADYFERLDFVSEEIYLAVRKDSALSDLNTVNIKNLRDEKFISMPKGRSIRDCLDNLFKKTEYQPNIAIECDDPHFICKYLEMGLGVTLFPLVSWKEQINENIKLLKINDGLYRHSYMYVNRSCSKIVKLFADKLAII